MMLKQPSSLTFVVITFPNLVGIPLSGIYWRAHRL
jgi:hypothetical protein